MQTATSLDSGQGVRLVDIGPERDGQRVDNALMTLLKGVPRSLVYRPLVLRPDHTTRGEPFHHDRDGHRPPTPRRSLPPAQGRSPLQAT